MSTCNLSDLIDAACTNKFVCVDNEQAFRALLLQLLCDIKNAGGTGSGVPSGVIVQWSGTIASIPTDWALCDGTNGTPDLRDKFVVGAKQDDAGVAKTNITGSLTQTGGTTAHYHSISSPGVTLSADSLNSGNYDPTDIVTAADVSLDHGTYSYAPHTHSLNAMDTSSVYHLPSYYALAYIMKL